MCVLQPEGSGREDIRAVNNARPIPTALFFLLCSPLVTKGQLALLLVELLALLSAWREYPCGFPTAEHLLE
jgi:hypothetical protein